LWINFDGEETLEPIEYLIDGVLPAEGVASVIGEWNVGKTFVNSSMDVCIAAGLQWMGHEVQRGTVVSIYAEGGRAFAVRKHAAKGHAGIAESAKLPYITIMRGLTIGAPETDDELVTIADFIKAEVIRRGFPPVRKVSADTLAQNIDGDESAAKDMSRFLRSFRAFIKSLSDGPVLGLIVHHPGHADKGRGRGSSALPGDVDCDIRLEGTPEALSLRCAKMRDGEKFKPIHLKLRQVVVAVEGEPLRDSRGREQTTLVVDPRDAPAPSTAPNTDSPIKLEVLRGLADIPDGLSPRALARRIGRGVTNTSLALAELKGEGRVSCRPGRQENSEIWTLVRKVAQ
jgi:hypothetical protein